jgi:germination protein M
MGASPMRSKAPRSAKRERRAKTRGGRRHGARHGGWKTFLFLWIGLMVVFAAVWAGYRFWTERRAKTADKPAGRTSPGTGAPAQQAVALYFSDEQAEYLVAEARRIPRVENPSNTARAVLEELIRGPRSGLQPTIPPGTQVRGDTGCQNGVCVVDLSGEVVSNHSGGSSGELMTVYSIVESLRANVKGFQSVQLLVNGKARETLAGHIAISGPLRSDSRYVRQ